MIPIIYQLRDSIRFVDAQNSILAVSEIPLNIIRVSGRAVRILQLCDGERTVGQISEETGIGPEEQVFEICDYFNKKAFLETGYIKSRDYFPTVTVIIPTKNRRETVAECLESVFAQDYPADRMETIVVDDGSQDETHTLEQLKACRYRVNQRSRGQSYCRNFAAKEARGEILAFLDSDCVAGRRWLRDLVQGFQWDKIGAVGGYVDGYSQKSGLDRYDRVYSSLHSGRYIRFGSNDKSGFYLPACNLLVRKEVFFSNGGFVESLHLGEDVDFCWRMRKSGLYALYVPAGEVKHKHRNRLRSMLRRRFDYGTSEAVLHKLHPEKTKILQVRPLPAVVFAGLCGSVLFLDLRFVLVAVLCFLLGALSKIFKLHKYRLRLSFRRVLFSLARIHTSSLYFLAFHLIRYYLILLIILGFAVHTLWILVSALLMYAAIVDYSVKRPQLVFPLFLIYYTLDHISYQAGVLVGCMRKRSTRSYRVRFI
jgi:mycofactocin system glycosyltransferase